MSDYSYLTDLLDSASGKSSSLEGVAIWGIIAAIIAVAGSILIYFLFVKSKEEQKGFAKKLKDFLSFKAMYVEALLKIFYYSLTIYLVLTSFSYLALGTEFILPFFIQLIFYPIVLRLAFELSMVMVRIWQNTSEIAGKKK